MDLARGPNRRPAAAAGEQPLFVSGCVPNQGTFYDRFDAVVLLSAPADVMLERIRTRTTNSFGGRLPSEQILSDLAEIEPRLRATATHEIVTTKPIDAVVAELIAIGAAAGARDRR